MRRSFFLSAAVFGSLVSTLSAQPNSRRATMVGGNTERGKCTIEVVVDGSAEVAVRGDTATLRNLTGQPPQWRRFECNGPLPANPADFRFAGVDGRGRQQLVQDPRNGGVAVVRIEDSQGGAEGYTFDLFWSNGFAGGRDRGSDNPGPVTRPDRDRRDPDDYRRDRDPEGYYRDRDAWFRNQNWRNRIFERVRQDVDYVQSETFPRGGDQFRLGRTLQELDELQGKLAAGRYDERELDEVIQALDRVVRDNRMSARNRQVLADDLDRLRDFRARHDRYGVR
jgi:hypothetical protein